MAFEAPIDWATIEDAIYDWMFAASGIITDWVIEDRPERPYPYVTLKRGNSTAQLGGRAELLERFETENPAGEEIEQTFAMDKEFVISCQCRTGDDSPAGAANQYLESAEAALEKLDVRTALSAAGAIVVESEGVLDLDAAIGQEWTSGASMDVRFRTLAKVTAKTGYIAKVGVEGTFDDVAGNTVVNYSEDIPP